VGWHRRAVVAAGKKAFNAKCAKKAKRSPRKPWRNFALFASFALKLLPVLGLWRSGLGCLLRRALLQRLHQRFPVGLGLVRIGVREGKNRVVEASGVADIGSNGNRIAGTSVAAGEQFAAEVGVGAETVGGERGEIERGLVIVELADKIVAAIDGGIAEERIGGKLHGALSVGDAVSVVGAAGGVFRQVGCIRRGRLLFE